jgi:hypothetical protein
LSNFFIENIFILSIKKYEDFSIILGLSKKFGKEKFLIKHSMLENMDSFDSGFLIQAKCQNRNNFPRIYEYKTFFSFDIDNIDYKRLFAVQSLASLIEKFILNIDDINIIIQYIPQIISIFYKENWLNLYIKIELKILSLYFTLNQSKNLYIKRLMKIETIQHKNKINNYNINNYIEIFNFQLQKLDNIWYNFDNQIILPQQRIVFKKLLINFSVK